VISATRVELNSNEKLHIQGWLSFPFLNCIPGKIYEFEYGEKGYDSVQICKIPDNSEIWYERLNTNFQLNQELKWDLKEKSSSITLLDNCTVAVGIMNDGIVRGTLPYTNGKHSWQFRILQQLNSMNIGIMTDRCSVDGCLGSGNQESWSYNSEGKCHFNSIAQDYGDRYGANDIVRVYLDMDEGTLHFSKNGEMQNNGLPAFSNLKGKRLYAACNVGNENIIELDSRDLQFETKELKEELAPTGPYLWETGPGRCGPNLKISEGGKKAELQPDAKGGIVFARRRFKTGKHQWQVQVHGRPYYICIGVCFANGRVNPSVDSNPNNDARNGDVFMYLGNGDVRGPGGIEKYGPALRENDLVSVHVDCDAGTIRFKINGEIAGKEDPCFQFPKPPKYVMVPFISLGNSLGWVTLHDVK